MKGKATKYWLVLHSRPDVSVSAEQKHARFFESIKELAEPWGFGEKPVPPPPEFRGASAVIGLTKFFGDGVSRAMVSYRHRSILSDDGFSDDLLNITFKPASSDLHYFVYTVVPLYAIAFESYLVEYFDDRMIDVAAEELKGLPVNPRSIVHRVGIVSFFDELLCRRAFDLSPAEVLDRMQGTIEHASLLQGGVYLVGSSQILPFDEAQQLCREMKAKLLS
jgi:hypothetical protein